MTASETDVTTARITADALATPADLTVRVVDRALDDQHFKVTVRSPWLPGLRDAEPEDWTLPLRAAELVGESMRQFTAPDVDDASRLYALRGAGVQLWNLAPEGFREAYRKLAREPHVLGTIQVVSDEKNIPWELMIPLEVDRRPLGQSCAVARWFTSLALRSVRGPLSDARVLMPDHDGVTLLEHAADELDLVLERVGGSQLTPAVPQTMEVELAPWAGAIVHVICHGKSGTTQQLLLDGKETLTCNIVEGMFDLRTAWTARDVPPILFLNACDAGRLVPALSGAGGLAGALATIGAGAIVAPLWSVRDEIAHRVAEHFYDAIAERPDRPYAEILRDIRTFAYDGGGEDSYAAYCYYGDPYASAMRP